MASHTPATNCDHGALRFEPSVHATVVGYCQPKAQQLAAAAAAAVTTTGHGLAKHTPVRNKKKEDVDTPAPLVLPGDDLSLDPRCPPQSLRAWLRLKERNEVTAKKSVVYIAAPPDVESSVDFVRTWSLSQQSNNDTGIPIERPVVGDIIDYLAAFFHGLPVKQLPRPKLLFTAWENNSGSRTSRGNRAVPILIPRFIGLNTATECIRIRTRASRDCAFAAQLNLDDLIDAAISMLPDDAYALLLLLQHDLFEDDKDDFVCGRAYGGSRVAVVSMARYDPSLDRQQKAEREHAWPAAHCEAYMQQVCQAAAAAVSAPSGRPMKKPKLQAVPLPTSQASLAARARRISSLDAAVAAHFALPSLDSSACDAALSGLWLGRVCRTASHELGHCFGMDHCVYYACGMQGSASIAEDARQPPYLCPVDLAKILRATGTDARQRYSALLSFCESHEHVHLFAAFAAWIRSRLITVMALEESALTKKEIEAPIQHKRNSSAVAPARRPGLRSARTVVEKD